MHYIGPFYCVNEKKKKFEGVFKLCDASFSTLLL